MNVLSLCNGFSGAYMALDELGYRIDNYYSSEVDKHANKAAGLINKNTIQLGDIRTVNVSNLKKIDLITAGTPCQDLSFAGGKSGLICNSFDSYMELRELWLKTQNEELYFVNGKYQQSILFWEFIRILREVQESNKNVNFFLENVKMDKLNYSIISNALGIEGQMIDSDLVSAQKRKRWYWSNIAYRTYGLFGEKKTYIEPPKDRSIFIKDIIQDESEVDDKYYIRNPKADFNPMEICEKARTLRIGGRSSQSNKHNFDIIKLNKELRVKSNQDKASTFTAGCNSAGNHSDMDVLCIAQRGRNPENPKSRKAGLPTVQMIEPRFDGKSNTLTTVEKDNMVLSCDYRSDEGYRVDYSEKSGTLTARARTDESCSQFAIVNFYIRKFTPTECFRLQTVPERFFKILINSDISESQLYKMIGNGWTIEIIMEFFKYLTYDKKTD